jgi:hypothetical protein
MLREACRHSFACSGDVATPMPYNHCRLSDVNDTRQWGKAHSHIDVQYKCAWRGFPITPALIALDFARFGHVARMEGGYKMVAGIKSDLPRMVAKMAESLAELITLARIGRYRLPRGLHNGGSLRRDLSANASSAWQRALGARRAPGLRHAAACCPAGFLPKLRACSRECAHRYGRKLHTAFHHEILLRRR